MGKKKRLLLEFKRTGKVREKYVTKFANLLRTITNKLEDSLESKNTEEPVVATIEPEIIKEAVEDKPKPKRTRSSTKKATTSTTKKKATTTTRRKRTTKAKPTTTDI